MGNSNTSAASAHNYYHLDIQTVSDDNNQTTLRAVIYLTTYSVKDTSNSCAVAGNWSRTGTLQLGVAPAYTSARAYDNEPVWYQDVSFAKGAAAYGVSVSCSWSGVDYWGNTLSASEGRTIAAKIFAPGQPGINADTITSSSARIVVTAPASNGGQSIDAYATYVLENNVWPDSAGAIIAASAGGGTFTATGLKRAKRYYYTSRAHNPTGGWGGWAAMKVFDTLAVVPTMGTAYSATGITRDTAVITGLSVTDNGGAAPDNARVQWNTSASTVGATEVARGSWGDVTVPGLPAGTLIYYRVAAHNSAGWSAYPATWKTFTTLTGVPSSMAAPTFSLVTDTTMRASWVAPALNGATFIAYRYEVSLDVGFGTLVTSGTTSALFVDLTGLIPGTKYYVRVRVNATPGNGGYGVGNQTMTGVVPLSGLRVYLMVPGLGIRIGTVYTFVGGVRQQLRPMYQHGGIMETE